MYFLSSLFTRNTVYHVPAACSSAVVPPFTSGGPNSAHNSCTMSILKSSKMPDDARKRAAACRARARPRAHHCASTAPILAAKHMFTSPGSP